MLRPTVQPSGQPATIKWITVGGRTSAYVTELQKVQSPKKIDTAPQEDEEEPEGDESDLTSLADEDPEPAAANATASTTRRSSRKRTVSAKFLINRQNTHMRPACRVDISLGKPNHQRNGRRPGSSHTGFHEIM